MRPAVSVDSGGAEKSLTFFIVLLIATAISIPIYANASAAVGGLFIALIGLGLLDLGEVMQPNQSGSAYRWAPAAEDHALSQAIILALMLCAGVLLLLDSQAAITLAVPFALVIAFTVWRQSGPPQWGVVLLGVLYLLGLC